ncbi:MAG: hypothetical protein N2508_09155 [Anaerolineae bacterium]|nr:hypothetical protein [Anaerolineae bacterium]
MVTPGSRDPWRVIWRIATSDVVLAILLVGIAALLLLMTWLPQRPSADPMAYSRWLAEAQARFGAFTPWLQRAGMLTLSSSLGFRTLLALLGGSLLLRVIEGLVQLRGELPGQEVSGWRLRLRHWPWSRTFLLVAQSGGLLFLIGLLINSLWGWEVNGLIVQRGERTVLPGTGGWVALGEMTQQVIHSHGLTVHIDERGPGVQACARNEADEELMLQYAAEAEPAGRLNLPLTLDQYFAVPDASLIVRLIPQHEGRPSATDPVLVQVYRVPSGQLAVESVLQGDGEVRVDGVTLYFTAAPYARLTVVHNPALGLICFALALLLFGLAGELLCTAQAVRAQDD